MLEIECSIPGQSLLKRRIAQGQYTIGRGLTADIRLRHDSVAKQHALLSVEDGQALLQDLGGQRLRRNGDVISKIAPVRTGDTFEIGDCELRVIDADGHAAQTAEVKAPRVVRDEPQTCVLPAEVQPQLAPIDALRRSSSSAF